jgi:GNAT superfamily N-acetyltransferase
MVDPMSALAIRDAVWPGDRKAAVSFIDGLQRYEHGVEPNRRIDASVGAEYLDVLLAAVAEQDGIVRIAELDGRAIGWGVAWHDLDDMYVVAEERRFVYISELYVEEAARGGGIGRALIASCEDWARAQGICIVKIGVLAGNTRAAAVYARAGYAPYATRLRKYLR